MYKILYLFLILLLLITPINGFKPITTHRANLPRSLTKRQLLPLQSTTPVPKYWAIQLRHSSNIPFTNSEADTFAKKYGFENVGPILHAHDDIFGESFGYYLMEVDVIASPDTNNNNSLLKTKEIVEELFTSLNEVVWFEYQVPRDRKSRVKMGSFDGRPLPLFSDPLFTDKSQWHLINQLSDRNPALKGHDINVTGVWASGVTGKGIIVSVIDDGVEYSHPDFRNWCSDCSYDFTLRDPDPSPRDPSEQHGTRCAGQIGGAADNAVCGVGVAYDVTLAGGRLITEKLLDSLEAKAFTHKMDKIDIYSNSWGPLDDGASLDGPGTLTKLALEIGAKTGRQGRGAIYVFASGNGGRKADNCNFDGYANSIYTIGIGGIDAWDNSTKFSEICAAQLAVTYAGTSELGLATTDARGKCTTSHTGTSSAAPIASGIIALMLQVRPELTWRDIQHLFVHSAIRNDVWHADWKQNGAKLWVNHYYGFGKLDAYRLVEASKTHRLLPNEAITVSASMDVGTEIIAQHPMKFRVEFSDTLQTNTTERRAPIHTSGIKQLEHAQVTIWLRAPIRGQVTIDLISPMGTISHLATMRPLDTFSDFNGWTFMTVRNWGENPVGVWTLQITDLRNPEQVEQSPSILEKWELKLYGTCSESDMVVSPSTGKTMCRDTVDKMNQSAMTMVLVLCFMTILLIGFGIRYYDRTKSMKRRRGGYEDDDYCWGLGSFTKWVNEKLFGIKRMDVDYDDELDLDDVNGVAKTGLLGSDNDLQSPLSSAVKSPQRPILDIRGLLSPTPRALQQRFGDLESPLSTVSASPYRGDQESVYSYPPPPPSHNYLPNSPLSAKPKLLFNKSSSSSSSSSKKWLGILPIQTNNSTNSATGFFSAPNSYNQLPSDIMDDNELPASPSKTPSKPFFGGGGNNVDGGKKLIPSNLRISTTRGGDGVAVVQTQSLISPVVVEASGVYGSRSKMNSNNNSENNAEGMGGLKRSKSAALLREV